MKVHTYCRLCDGACGLLAEIGEAGALALTADPSDPVSEGFICEAAIASAAGLRHPDRVTQPLHRVDGELRPASWDEAITDIGERLRTVRSHAGVGGLGVYLGGPVMRSSAALIRGLSFGVGLGTANIFSELSEGLGPRLRVTELMLGHPTPLLSDLGRAHYALLLGGDQRETDWGPGNLGMSHHAWLQHSRGTKKTRVVVADVRHTALGAEVDGQLRVRPGTEPFLLLGMLSAAVRGSWHDKQYVADHTRGWDTLVELLEPWPLDRCAAICGVDAAELSGVALKFSRAAMAVVHPGVSAFANRNATVGAWAWLALHAVTANALRPGGLYDHNGVFDLHYPLAAVPSEGAPRTRVGEHRLLLLQAPATAMPDEALVPGDGRLRALVCVSGNPAATLPGRARVAEALADLELLVCLTRELDETCAHADWILPVAHPWEESDLNLLDAALLPRHMVRRTPPVAEAAGEARPVEQVLRDIFVAVRPGFRHSAWGLHLAALGQGVARADLETWLRRTVDWSIDEGWKALSVAPHRVDRGEADRSAWRVLAPEERIDLAPPELVELVRRLEEPRADPDLPLWLRTSGRVGRRVDRWCDPTPDPGLRLHPDAGVPEGAEVEVVTRFGRTWAVVHLDPSLRADTADLPAGFAADAGALLSPSDRDPLSGTANRDGIPCKIEVRKGKRVRQAPPSAHS